MTDSQAETPADRIGSLDLIRGVAVLGILAVNIAGFAGPSTESLTPNFNARVDPADEWAFAAIFLVFEGKMRALFTLLFGASMVLFIERNIANGRPAIALQMRRLLWLALFGYLHFLLFWWGDILFFYALAGLLALPLYRLRPKLLTAIAVAAFTMWQGYGIADRLPDAAVEEEIRLGTASSEQISAYSERLGQFRAEQAKEVKGIRSGFVEHAHQKISNNLLDPVYGAIAGMGETLPMLLIGMALFRSGFFSGAWSPAALRRLAIVGTATGAIVTLALLAWVMPRHFPPNAMAMLALYATAWPHLLMALGYAAALVLAAPRLLKTRIGARIDAAGKMAFSNYLGTTVVMTALFYGWGLGLFGRFDPLGQVPFVVLGWVLMLAWSKPWLARYRRGPLEWLWRSLVEWRMLPNGRRAS